MDCKRGRHLIADDPVCNKGCPFVLFDKLNTYGFAEQDLLAGIRKQSGVRVPRIYLYLITVPAGNEKESAIWRNIEIARVDSRSLVSYTSE